MDTPDNTSTPAKTPRKNLLFLVGTLVGILLGALLTMFLVDWLDYRRPTEVHVVSTPAASASDTVVKYVIHRHENVESAMDIASTGDSIAIDTAFEDATEDLYLDDELEVATQNPTGLVSSDEMLAKQQVRVQYLDNNKKEIPVPEDGVFSIQVQQWNTPVRNKYTYQFSGAILKIKGMSIQNIRLIHFKGQLYLVRGSQTFAITPNTHFERLTETRDTN